MLIKDIIAVIEEIAPPECQASWDKSGLQVTSLREDAEKIVVFLDPLPEVLKQAIEAGGQFLLSHHPLSLRPDLPEVRDNWFLSLRELFRADTPLYAAHTSLDINLQGPAGWLGEALGLEGVAVLDPVHCSHNTGFGYGGIGNLPVAKSFREVLDKILSLVNCGSATLCGPLPDDDISRVAWCGGSGASLISQAASMGAELFVTGDVKYHSALEARIPVLDVGHHSIEEIMMERFAALLRKCLPDLEICFLSSCSPFINIQI